MKNIFEIPDFKADSIVFRPVSRNKDTLPFTEEYRIYTNVMNLFLFLSSGVIHPVSYFRHNNYFDFSTHGEKGLVLYKNPVNLESLKKIMTEDYHYPVCLTLTLFEESPKMWVIDKDYQCREKGKKPLESSDIALYLTGAISAYNIKAIVFYDEESYKYYDQKKKFFKNTNFDFFEFKVDESQFRGNDFDAGIIYETCENIGNGEDDTSEFETRYLKFLRLMGGAVGLQTSFRQTNNLRLLCDYIYLMSFCSSSESPDNVKKAFKELNGSGIKYDDFNFTTSFYLLSPLLVNKYESEDINTDLKNFFKEFMGARNPQKQIVSNTLAFTIIRTIMSMDPESEDFSGSVEKLQAVVTDYLKKEHKINKKLSDELNERFAEALEITDHKKEVDVLTDWDDIYLPLKCYVRFIFNPDFERALSTISENKKDGIPDIEKAWMLFFAGLYSRYDLLHSDRKKEQFHYLKLTDTSLRTFNLGSFFTEEVLKPNLDIESERKQSLIAKKNIVKGINGQDIVHVLEKSLFDIIIENPVPEEREPLTELARILGLNDLIYTDVLFEDSDYKLEVYKKGGKKLSRLRIGGAKPEIRTEVDAEGLKEKLKALNQGVSMSRIPKELTDRIYDLYGF